MDPRISKILQDLEQANYWIGRATKMLLEVPADEFVPRHDMEYGYSKKPAYKSKKTKTHF